jgi:hypothetical protein
MLWDLNIRNLWGGQTVLDPNKGDSTRSPSARISVVNGLAPVTTTSRRRYVDKAARCRGEVPLVSHIHHRLANQSIGVGGLLPSWVIPEDPDFSEEVNRHIRQWTGSARMFSPCGRRNLKLTQRLAITQRCVMGELFLLFRRTGPYGIQVQALSSNAICGTSEDFVRAGYTLSTDPAKENDPKKICMVYDGIAYDFNDLPLAYRISTGKVFSASDIYHVMDSTDDVDARRGLPLGYQGLNYAVDLFDTLRHSVASSKFQAMFSFIRRGRTAFGKALKRALNGKSAPVQVDSIESDDLARELGKNSGIPGAIIELPENEKLEALPITATSDRVIATMDELKHTICLASDMSPEFVLSPSKIGSTAYRGVMGELDQNTRHLQEVAIMGFTVATIARFIATISQPITAKDAEGNESTSPNGLLSKPLPASWESYIKVQYPASPSVDYGRDTRATLALLDAGQTTNKIVQEQAGNDPVTIRRERIAEVAQEMDECEAARNGKGIPYEAYRALKNPNAMVVEVQAQAAQ